MLTADEKRWLQRRKNLCSRCAKYGYCKTGKKHGFNTETCRFWEIRAPKGRIFVNEDFQDAAEFEARVAERLARNTCYNCPDLLEGCPTAFEYPRRTDKSCRMKHARLAVEDEMDRKS